MGMCFGNWELALAMAYQFATSRRPSSSPTLETSRPCAPLSSLRLPVGEFDRGSDRRRQSAAEL